MIKHQNEIIAQKACLTELGSNPKSFSNCPDLHGGVPGLPGGKIGMSTRAISKSDSAIKMFATTGSVGYSKANVAMK
jgi:hypothetical protein